MTPKYVILRECLRWNRPNLMNYLSNVLFVKMAQASVAAIFPGAAAFIGTIIRDIGTYNTDHGLHHTIAANIDWTKIKEDTGILFDYIDLTAANDPTKIELTGLPVAVPAGHGSPDPQTGSATNVKVIAEGGLLYRAEYEADEFAHHFRGRTKLHTDDESKWFDEGESQNHTMYFTGKQYAHGSDVDVEIMPSGTKGEANAWSALGTVLIN